jgi:hypothetical protein
MLDAKYCITIPFDNKYGAKTAHSEHNFLHEKALTHNATVQTELKWKYLMVEHSFMLGSSH